MYRLELCCRERNAYILFDCFHIVLFSALKQTHCTVVKLTALLSNTVWKEWLAFYSTFWVPTKVVTVPFGCYITGATWNCCRLGTCSVYTIQPYTSLQCNFIWTHIGRVCCGMFCHQGEKGVKFDTLPARFITLAGFVTMWWQIVPKGLLAAWFVFPSPAPL